MDAALLLIAANESCPQPQTSEHLAAVEIMRLENIIILQNKVDLIREEAALAQHKDIVAFVKGALLDFTMFWAQPPHHSTNYWRVPRI